MSCTHILMGVFGAIFSMYAHAATQIYTLLPEPVDVVIPSIEKDLVTLDLCIEGVKKYVQNVRRIIVVSHKKLTDQAEWFDEKQYPFTKHDIAQEIFGNSEQAYAYVTHPNSRVSWLYQQLLKLYAPLVIPDISSNVLIVDSDAIFLNTVTFVDERGWALYAPGTRENSHYLTYPPYVAHMKQLLPDLHKIWDDYTGIAHHMLFQRAVIKDLFDRVETRHNTNFWRALCRCIDRKQLFKSPFSEYEIYFNFLFSHTCQCKIRLLKWKDVKTLDGLEALKQEGYDYVACHSYARTQ